MNSNSSDSGMSQHTSAIGVTQSKERDVGRYPDLRASKGTLAESLKRIRHIVRKEFIQIKRSRQNLGLLLIAPLIQLLIFGSASRLDVHDVSTVVADMDRSVLSRQIIEAFSRSGYFTVKQMLSSYDEADRWLETGRAGMAILIPPDLEQRIKANRTALVGVLIDGVDTTTAGTVSGYAQSILQRFSVDIMDQRVSQMQGQLFETATPHLIVPAASEASRAWFNPNLNSKDFFVPGVVVIILLAGTTIVTSSVIVREKEIGTIEQTHGGPHHQAGTDPRETHPLFYYRDSHHVSHSPAGIPGIRHTIQGLHALFYGHRGAVSHNHCRDRNDDFNLLQDSATGGAHFIHVLTADYSSFGLCLPHRKHASGDPVHNLLESSSLLHHHRTRSLLKRDRMGYPLASGNPDDCHGHLLPGIGRVPVQEES